MTPIHSANSVKPTYETSEVGVSRQAEVWDQPADLVIISGPGEDKNMLKAVLDSAQKKGLTVKLIGDGERALNFDEIAVCRQSGAMGPATQVFVSAHGGRIDEQHTIEYDSDKKPISTAEFMHLLRGTHPDGEKNNARVEDTIWKGTVHLMSCASGKMRVEISEDETLHQNGNYVLHSSGKSLHSDSVLCNALSIVDYLEECKRERSVPDLYAMGRRLIEVTGESLTLTQPHMTTPLIVHAPKTPQHIQASYLSVNKNSGEKPTITGDEKDIHQILLSRQGENPSTTSRQLEKAFNTFCVRLERKKFDEAASLLDKFPELAKGISGRISPLTLSIVNFHMPILSKLVLEGANINERDEFDNTALALACSLGNKDAVEFLIHNGGVTDDCFGESDLSIFHLAVNSNNADLVRYLAGLRTVSDIIDFQNNNGITALQLAIRYGNTEMIQVFTDSHADVTLQDSSGKTALHYAVMSGDLDAIELLISEDANVAKLADHNRLTPLHLAARQGDLEAMQILVNAGADLSAQDKYEKSALHYAVASGNLDAVRLIARQADINKQDKDGNTALHLAASTGNLEIVKILLKQTKPSLALKNKDGFMAIILAGRNQHLAVLAEMYSPSDPAVSAKWKTKKIKKN